MKHKVDHIPWSSTGNNMIYPDNKMELSNLPDWLRHSLWKRKPQNYTWNKKYKNN